MNPSVLRASRGLLFFLPLIGCIRQPNLTDVSDEGVVFPSSEPPLEEVSVSRDSPFCTSMRPVTALLKRDIAGDVECVNTDYNETGSFGSSVDAMESSFKNACFRGFSRYEAEVETHERPLGSIRGSISADVEIDRSGRIDLTEYGVIPAVYQFQEFQGPLAASVTIGFREPALRSVRDLGYTLSHIASNPATPADVRQSIQRCTTQLCGEETVYTSSIVSALPEVFIEIKRGAAARLRPTSSDANVKIRHTSARSFVIQPTKRLNLAARTSPSRDMMVGQDACGKTKIPPSGQCQTITYRGIRATYHGCGRVGGTSSHKITCQFSLSSPGYDQEVELYVGEHGRHATTLIDDQGAPHTASWGELANIKTERLARTVLVADVPTKLVLHYDDLPKEAKGISRLTLRLKTETYVDIDFPDVKLLDDASFAPCDGEG